MGLDTAGRWIILRLADSPTVRRLVTRYGMKLGAGRFTAGETLDEAVQVVKRLNRDGLKVTLDNLGESVAQEAQARAAAAVYLDILDRIAADGLDANVSVKLTQLGLELSTDLAYENIRRVVERATALGNFVRIDMEHSDTIDRTLEIYRRLRQDFDNVGVVIQAMLYRSEEDLRGLAAQGANVRLVKGAYAEPPDRAYPRKADVDANYRRLIAYYLQEGRYTAVATHDEAVIDFTRRFVAEHNIPRDRFEFQMLLGIRPDLQRRLAAEGYTVRVYVPYGTDWYPYLMRRLAERPANLGFLLRNLFRR
ncbi:MAG: proline dehydrogenase family protein [Thermaerobacter sp.]|nr:proline dehydrogenase [Bacillota bacterium]REJ38416.1 MAG: proline dehydrogenase [Bacillota bacterium]